MKDIKTVRSHSQAIGQCNKIILENKFTPIISADTAGSAKFVAEKKIRANLRLPLSLRQRFMI